MLGFCLESSRYIVVREVPHGPDDQESQRCRQMESCVTKRSFLGRRFGVNASRIHFFEELGRKSIPLHNDWRGIPLMPDPNRDPVPRRLYLKQSDFMAHGTSDRCPGCRASVSGGRVQGHTEECRIRVEGEIRKTEEG